MYPNGRHNRARVVGTGIARAFDMAQNTEGNVFVTANGGDQVFGFRPNGGPTPGIAVRRLHGLLRSRSAPPATASATCGSRTPGVIDIPCSTAQTLEVPAPARKLRRHHRPGRSRRLGTRFGGAGMTMPWGIAVDGDDNIWVANFAGKRLSHLCGARASTCPTGHAGAAISPPTAGYAFDGLQRNTGVQIDPSGNVWLANNWIEIPVQTDPFGDGLVVYLGMAAR